PRVAGAVDARGVPHVARLDARDRRRSALPARRDHRERRDPARAQLLEAAPGSRLRARPIASPSMRAETTLVLGAGPAGLTASYARAAVSRKGPEESLEDWVSNRFGRRLFELFFKTYTEKVWGVPTTEIRAEWAAQRIRGLSFTSAARAAFFGNRGNKVKTLI